MSCNPLIEENERERERDIERCSMYHTGCMNKLLLLFITCAKNIMNANGPYKLYEKDLKDLTSFHKKNIVYKRIKDKTTRLSMDFDLIW